MSKKNSINLTVTWGDDCAESTLELTTDEWKDIQAGGEFEDYAESDYEGEIAGVTWRFKDGHLSIYGEEGRECILDEPVKNLDIQEISDE
jgi:hypothetical protein